MIAENAGRYAGYAGCASAHEAKHNERKDAVMLSRLKLACLEVDGLCSTRPRSDSAVDNDACNEQSMQ